MKQLITQSNKLLPDTGFTSFWLKAPHDSALSPGITNIHLPWPISFQWKADVNFLFSLGENLSNQGVLLLGHEFQVNHENKTELILHVFNLTQNYIQVPTTLSIVKAIAVETIQFLQADLKVHPTGLVDTTPPAPKTPKTPKKPAKRSKR